MKIVFLGNHSVDFSTETHLAKSLETLGHDVIRAQENRVTAEEVIRMLPGADLFMWTRTADWLKGDAWAMIDAARDLGIPSAAVHLDLYAPIARNNDPENHPWWRCEWVFTADGGSDAFWDKLGIRHRWFRPGVYGPECYIAEVPTVRDVAFVGQYTYHGEHKWRPQLIDWLKETYGPHFTHMGHSRMTTIRGDALNRFYAGTKVIVGDSLCVGFKHPRYWSDRLPETTGRGGFIIFPDIDGIRDLYSEKELVTYEFGDFDGLKRKIDYYLEHNDERERIRKAGHEATKRHSTYEHRMKEVLDTIFPPKKKKNIVMTTALGL